MLSYALYIMVKEWNDHNKSISLSSLFLESIEICCKYERQHPTKPQLYGHLPSITKTIKVRWTRRAGHCWRIKDELISDVFIWPSKSRMPSSDLHTADLRIWDVALRTSQKWLTIEKSGERGSRISMLAARHDDDDDRETESKDADTGWRTTTIRTPS